MKNIGWLFFITLVCYSIWQMSQSVVAQQTTEHWIEAEAKVLDTRTRVVRRNTYAYAKVSFRAVDEKEYETEAKLLAIPFIGTTLSPNETVTILYDAEKPMIAKSPSVRFIDSYGLYVLVIAGACLSFLTLRKTLARKNDSHGIQNSL